MSDSMLGRGVDAAFATQKPDALEMLREIHFQMGSLREGRNPEMVQRVLDTYGADIWAAKEALEAERRENDANVIRLQHYAKWAQEGADKAEATSKRDAIIRKFLSAIIEPGYNDAATTVAQEVLTLLDGGAE